jgi:broad specificity phosphatase PhoE
VEEIMLELLLARHGQSHGNLDRTQIGTDTDLTDLGREQATKLGRWLAEEGHSFAAIYASSLRRARQTAEIINAHYGLDITFDPDLRETERPYLDQLPRRTEPLGTDPPAPYGPEYETMRHRVMCATSRILADNPTGKVLVVAHAGTCGTMLRGILRTQTLIVRTDLAAVHRLSWQNGLWNVHYINSQEHVGSKHTRSPEEKSV